MKPQTLLALFLIVAFFLGGCGQSSSTALPGAMNQHPSSTLNSPTAQFDDVRLWIGKDPLYSPGMGTPLEKVTSVTIETFAKLMSGDPNQACFIFNGNAMP